MAKVTCQPATAAKCLDDVATLLTDLRWVGGDDHGDGRRGQRRVIFRGHECGSDVTEAQGGSQ